MCAPWINGTCAGYTFQAMVFEESSHYGINEGRISKLIIIAPGANGWANPTTSYDRGWDVNAETGKAAQVQAAVIAFLESLPVVVNK